MPPAAVSKPERNCVEPLQIPRASLVLAAGCLPGVCGPGQAT